jgi:hypothetical protein
LTLILVSRRPVTAVVRHDKTVKVEAMSELLETAFLIILALATCFFIYTIVTSYYYQYLLGRQLEDELGFKDGAAYIRVGRRTHSAVCLTDITPDGVFHRAGLRAGNVVPELSHTDLFRYLHRNRGKTIDLVVVDGGPGPPFYERQQRAVRILVPAQSK